ncbi:MAG: hypothetical protein HY074_06105 [Deltaproteobacteria bacterium]|nr:hypothetical protein [Deltaproteobacteria bacterium]
MNISILAITALTLVSTAQAADFCANPYDAICEAPGRTHAEREARVQLLLADVKNEALAETTLHFGGKEGKFKIPFFGREMLYYNDQIAKIAADRLTPLELNAVLDNVERVKGYLKDSLVEQNVFGNITDAERAQMTDIVDRTQVYTQFGLLKKYGGSGNLLNLNLLSYHMTCGFDGLSNNAFASLEKDTPYIVLCPGWLVRAVGAGADTSENFRNIIQVMSHELGHHIDAGKFPQIYTRFMGCLARQHGELLQFGKDWYESLIASLPPEYGKFTKLYKVFRHSREITADFWGAQSVRQYLATLAPNQRLESLQTAWSGICGSQDEGVHPTGRYRIEVLLRSDPEIHRLMGCAQPDRASVPAPKKGCTLSGASSGPVF